MKNALLHNPHVGEILKHEFLEELGITEGDLANAIGVSPSIIKEITQTPSKITAEIEIRNQLDDMDKAAAAKLKVALPIIPIIPYNSLNLQGVHRNRRLSKSCLSGYQIHHAFSGGFLHLPLPF